MSLWYDALAETSEGKITEQGLHALAPGVGEAALEVGFGTGRSLVANARAVGASGRTVGVDISKGMLAAASRRARGAGLHGRIPFLLGDAVHLPFRSGAFDAIFMSYSLELIDTPEIPHVLDECHRILKAQGRLGIVALSKRPGGPMANAYRWAHRRFPRIADCRPIPVRDLLERASFRITFVKEKTMWGIPVDIASA